MRALSTLRRRPTTPAPSRRRLDSHPRSGAFTTAVEVLALQRAAGNRATASLLASVQRLPVAIEPDAPDTTDETAFEHFVWGIERSQDTDRLELLYHWLVQHYDDDPEQTDQIVRLAQLIEDILTGERMHPDDVAKQLALEEEQEKKAAAATKPAETRKRPAKIPAPAKPTEKQLREAEREQQRQAEKLAEQQELAKQRAQWDLEAPIYWQRIQNEPGNAGHGGALKFLVMQGYLEVRPPHRCFLSRYERKGHQPHGPRHGKRFGLSRELVPRGVLAAHPGRPLVVHLHCGGDGRVRAGSIKFRATERQPGDNILLESKFVDYLRCTDINGGNVTTKVGAWS